MKNILINIVVGIICLISGAVAAKDIFNVLKLIPMALWVWLGVIGFMCLVVFFFYQMLRMFPDMYSNDEEINKGGINK